MHRIVKYILFVFLTILSISLISCDNKVTASTYTPVKETTDPYDLEGKETIITKNIVMHAKFFVNTVTNDTVNVLHHLDKTGFHFYNAVAFKSEKEGVIVGGAGLKIRTTTDGGLHWQENRFSKFANPFHSVVINKDNIFVVGESQFIYKSSDFGKNWEVFDTNKLIENTDKDTQKSFSSFSTQFYKIKFYNNNTGLIVGDYNKAVESKPILLKTTDAGKNWTMLTLNGLKDAETGISDFIMLSEQVIFMVTFKGSCYKSTDGGSNWQLLFNNDKLSLNSIYFINENEGYIGGMSSVLLYTKDGGKTWEAINLISEQNGIIYHQKFAGEYKRVPTNKYSINISNIKYIDGNTTLITLANEQEFEKDFLYEIQQNSATVKSVLSKKDTSVVFIGEAYGLYKHNSHIYILDRNNLYRINNQ